MNLLPFIKQWRITSLIIQNIISSQSYNSQVSAIKSKLWVNKLKLVWLESQVRSKSKAKKLNYFPPPSNKPMPKTVVCLSICMMFGAASSSTALSTATSLKFLYSTYSNRARSLSSHLLATSSIRFRGSCQSKTKHLSATLTSLKTFC